MKETQLSNLERDFSLTSLCQGLRLDGRRPADRRELRLELGAEAGSCMAALGDTRVLAQVSCALCEPQLSRPNEGQLRIQVEFAPMAAPRFAEGRPQDCQDERVELLRLLERCFRESGCLDLESLCVVSESSAWAIRVDVHVLNHEGNVAEASSAAVLTALAHFRRPDVTLKGQEVIVHSVNERDPVPLSIHHYPVLATFAFFKPPKKEAGATATAQTGEAQSAASQLPTGELIVCADPTHQEEALMAGKLVFGANPYKEICTLHLAGDLLIEKGVVLRYAQMAGDYAKATVERIKKVVATDNEARAAGAATKTADDELPLGFAQALKREDILSTEAKEKKLDLASLSATLGDARACEGAGGNAAEDVGDEMSVVEAGNGVVEMLAQVRAQVERTRAEAEQDANAGGGHGSSEEEEEMELVDGGGLG